MEFADPAPYYWGNLTWEELRQAAAAGRVVIQPIGATEQHGYHLPLDTDNYIVTRLCDAAARRAPNELLILPTVPYAFNAHHMDFPGVIAIQWDHVVNYLIDAVLSAAHHGFDRFIFISGHGVNPPYLAVVDNEVNVRTGALSASLLWTVLIDNLAEIRDSVTPGGMAHACELETSVMLHLDPRRVRADKIVDEFGFRQGEYLQMDLGGGTGVHFGEHWWSSFSKTGVAGEATVATAEKGRLMFERAADNLVRLARELRARPDPARDRVDLHGEPERR
jgi:creatinine amidohydrolase